MNNNIFLTIKRKLIKKVLLVFKTLIFLSLAYPHCQVPCGIYDDAARIIQIREDVITIRKSMLQIKKLSDSNNEAQNTNQLIRWVNTKEEHSRSIQNTISEYFLTQRLKYKNSDTADRQEYIEQVTLLHRLLISAMKCRQTLDINHCDTILSQLDQFSNIYFDEHGLKHLNKISH